MREINEAGITLIKSFEGLPDGNPKTLNLDWYVDPIGILTIGYGHAITFGRRFLRNTPTDKALATKLYPHGITFEAASDLLRRDLQEHLRDMAVVLRDSPPLTDNQYAALASFCFNVGPARLASSTLLRLVNLNRFAEAAEQFKRWNKADGRVLAGLTRRRAAERLLFLTPSREQEL